MSLNSAMLAGVSGLAANSAALSSISDNIANANTIGYKENETTFESLVAGETNGDGSSVSGGVTGLAQQLVTQQGLIQGTNSVTDLAIQGSGFFVVTPASGSPSSTNAVEFTRAGSFTVDSQGNLVNAAGLYLQGWPVNSAGEVLSDPTDATKLATINVTSIGGAASPTSEATISANLQGDQTVSTDATITPPATSPAYDPATNSMAMYDATTGTGVKPDFTIQIPVSDSKGGEQTVQLDLLKSSTPNEWYAEIVSVPASNVTDGTGLSNGQIATGMIAFTPNGQYDPTGTTLFADPTNPAISLGASNAAAPAAGAVNWAPSLGVDAQNVTISLGSSGSAGGLTQFDSPSAVSAVTSNGTTFGNLTSIKIDENGFVTAVFDNGVTRQIAQVAVATVPNADGLTQLSGDAYRISTASGNFTLKAAGSGGAGTIAPSSLEASTVDLSTEFTNLITTQQAYSASSKIITTADNMMQDLINVIR
jgi:flagellar hook protein FlgE